MESAEQTLEMVQSELQSLRKRCNESDRELARFRNRFGEPFRLLEKEEERRENQGKKGGIMGGK